MVTGFRLLLTQHIGIIILQPMSLPSCSCPETTVECSPEEKFDAGRRLGLLELFGAEHGG
jgi:hypothetical protein